VVNDWGAIEEIHILTGLGRNPKQIVRDVQSAQRLSGISLSTGVRSSGADPGRHAGGDLPPALQRDGGQDRRPHRKSEITVQP
jgi:hypothetical protein